MINGINDDNLYKISKKKVMRRSSINKENTVVLKKGTLLCATPINSRKGLLKSLLLITEHSELGSSAIILNNPLGKKLCASRMEMTSQEFQLNYGGPDDDLISYIVNFPSLHNGWKDSTYWSRDCDDINILLGILNPRNISISVFKGSVNWLPGELEIEIAGTEWWSTNEYNLSELTSNKSGSWKTVAKKLSGFFAPLIEADIPINYN